MDYHVTENGAQVDVKLTGKFTIEDADDFRSLFDWSNKKADRSITLDLTNLQSIDSAGLGMLLYANSRTADKKWKFSIANPVGQVEKMIRLSRIDELITIVNSSS
jgi:anti-anti-sigma factor